MIALAIAPLVVTRLCLVATFAIAGISKISTPNRTRRSLEQFGVPRVFTGLATMALPLSEVSVSLGLALRSTVHVAAAGALGLLCVFTAAVSLSLWKGRRPDCACFGGIRTSQIGALTIGRNLILAFGGCLLFVCDPAREFVPAGQHGRGIPLASEIILTVGLGFGLVLAGLALFRRRRACPSPALSRKRSAVLKGRSSSKFKPIRQTGLAIGTNAPRFALPLLDRGGAVTLEWLARGGRAALLVFTSPNCGQCAALLPAVAQLENNADNRLRVAVVSSGDAESSRRMLSGCAVNVVATDVKARVAQLFRVAEVPSAVLIGPNGAIAAQTVVGAQAVRNFLTALAGAR